MSIHNFATANLAGASGSRGFYNGATSRSLRFDGGSYAHKVLSHTPSTTKGTWSLWYKPSPNGAGGWGGSMEINARGWSGGSGSQSGARLYFNNGRIAFTEEQNNSELWSVKTQGYWRDSSAWTHVVVRMDLTQGTNTNKVRIYVNGNQINKFITYTTLPSSSNRWGGTGNRIGVGDDSGSPWSASYFHGQMADFHYTSGYDYAADSFGEFKNGAWIPLKNPSVTYGDAGWRFQFLETGTSADANGIFADTKTGNSNLQHFELG